ncbi:MAG: class II aldolase and adducin N-terminal domain-containing protein [Rhodobacteraceae bacterium]|nr:class II aldolase and adducin N-terminal domain-containing protein [Paracoccaceae bacterium]
MNSHTRANLTHAAERADLAAALRWTAELGMNEGVANHFSLAVNPDGTRFLINPFARAFETIRASDLLLVDAMDPDTLNRPGAPDPTAWGLHGSIHRRVPHARCVMHVHSIHATVLACLQDARLPPLDQNAAMFFGPRQVVDAGYGGMAFESEGERCAGLLADPRVMAMVMGNHGVLVIGRTVAEAFMRLYYFERAAETYVRALQTGRPLRILSDEVAEKTAREWEDYPSTAEHFLNEIKAMLDARGAGFRD